MSGLQRQGSAVSGALTLFESDSLLAKQWKLDGDGKPVKTTAAQLSRGTYRVATFDAVEELADLIGSVTTRQAISASLPLDGSTSGDITTKGDAVGRKRGAKTRSKTDFGLQARPGFALIDIDGPQTRSVSELWALLVSVLPALAGSACVALPSGSSHIHHGADDLTGLRGVHYYLTLKDANDWPRVARALEVALWNAGYGRIEVSAAGSLLKRCLIDLAVNDPARLIFSGAECMGPLEQRRGLPMVLSDGPLLDSVGLIRCPTAAELGRYEARVQEAKAAAGPEAQRRKAEHRAEQVRSRVPKLIAEGVAAGDAERRITEAIDASYSGMLLPDFVLTVVGEDGAEQAVTIDAVLSDRDRWDGWRCLDPLNPEHRDGAADGKLFLHGTSPIVYSFDDGGRVYRLRRQRRLLTVRRGDRAELVSALVGIVADLDQVFSTATGPVVIENGRRFPLTVDRLMNLVGAEVTLQVKTKDGNAGTDLTRDVAGLVLTGLQGGMGLGRIAA